MKKKEAVKKGTASNKESSSKKESSPKPIVLVVEDEISIAKAQELILSDRYQVHIAHDGETGLTKAKQLKPHVVVLDIMMPKMSGYDVCRQIRNDSGLSSTRIVMVTAKNQDKDEALAMDLGADDYIMKPFEPEELLHVINQVLKNV